MPRTLTGQIQDSAGVGITGKLYIKVDAPIIDISTSPDRVIYGKETFFNITNGSLTTGITNSAGGAVASISLQESDSVTYTFRFTYVDTQLILYLNGVEYKGFWHKDGALYYTGEVNFAGRQQLTPFNRTIEKDLFDPFSAKILTTSPNPIEWASIQPSSIASSNIDTSLFAIAQLLVNTQNLLQSLVAGIYNPRGNYSAGATYNRGDVVYDPNTKGSYWWIFSTPGNNPLPTVGQSNAYWQVLITSTEVTSSTVDLSAVLLNTAFAPGWNGVTNKAPTADVLYDQMINYALLQDATFARVRMPTRPQGDAGTDGASTAFVQGALNAYTPPSATTAPDILLTDNSSKIVNSRTLKLVTNRIAVATEEAPPGSPGGSFSAGAKTRIFGFLPTNTNGCVVGITDGYVQLQANARYWIEAESCGCALDKNRIILIDQAGNYLLIGRSEESGLRGYQQSYVGNVWTEVKGFVETGGSPLNVSVRHFAESSGTVNDGGKASSRPSGINEIYARMTIFRLD